ncbi:MAG: hypothetical protein U0234_02935 [Sandaracinus sp.]
MRLSLTASFLIALVSIAGCGTAPSEPVDASGADGGSAADAAADDAASTNDDGGAGETDAATVDAATPQPCSTPGTAEMAPCGACGSVTRFCGADHVWAYGLCENEGACMPGTTRTGDCGHCGSQTERCTASCTWEPDSTCTGEGECAPGDTMRSDRGCPAGQLHDFTCSDSCVFEATNACMADACPTPGVTETSACGRCGTTSRFCTSAHTWTYGPCMNEGPCMAGEFGTTSCGMCGTQSAFCNTSCQWVPQGACVGEGVCAPGTTVRTSMGCPSGQTRLASCDAACGLGTTVEACRATVPVDVLFLIDGTPSNRLDVVNEVSALVSHCVDPLLALRDVQVGLAWYGDMTAPAEPFVGAVEIGAGTSSAISSAISFSMDIGGGEDSTMEALSIVTGGTPATGSVPFACSAGRTAGGCWRTGAQRVVVLHSDEAAKGGPNAAGGGLWNPWPSGASWTTVQPRLMADHTLLLPIFDSRDNFVDGDPPNQYRAMVTSLGQPASDVRIEDAAGIAGPCDAVVARVRALAGL